MARYAPQTNIFKDCQGESYYVWREKKKKKKNLRRCLSL